MTSTGFNVYSPILETRVTLPIASPAAFAAKSKISELSSLLLLTLRQTVRRHRQLLDPEVVRGLSGPVLLLQRARTQTLLLRACIKIVQQRLQQRLQQRQQLQQLRLQLLKPVLRGQDVPGA
jgi:hypothetical protein